MKHIHYAYNNYRISSIIEGGSHSIVWLRSLLRAPDCGATIQGWRLFKGGYYSRVATIQGRLLLKGGYYSREATIKGWRLLKGGDY